MDPVAHGLGLEATAGVGGLVSSSVPLLPRGAGRAVVGWWFAFLWTDGMAWPEGLNRLSAQQACVLSIWAEKTENLKRTATHS